MMRSMFSGVSGLRVHQTRMDVIGNNIANVNTVGYKSQRVTFSDVFSQTISNATSASDDTGRGGTNAMQVGLGVNVSSIDMLMTQGAAQRTDNPFDVMINGDGFMVVGDATGQYFTRAGALRLDEQGNLVIANGMKVQGWLANEEGKISAQEVQDINLFDPRYDSMEPTTTTKAQISGNINSTDTSKQVSISVYDSLGNCYKIPFSLDRASTTDANNNVIYTPNKWTLSLANSKITDAAGNEVEIESDAIFNTSEEKIELEFNENGKLISPSGTDLENLKLTVAAVDTDTLGSTFDEIALDLSTLTQYATKSTVEGKAIDGNSAGTISGYGIGDNGIITANYTNGEQRDIAQVVLTEFDNAAGLEKVGDNLYSATANSGEFDGIGNTGDFNTGVLEMSNVDLSSEFTDMIVTQRGFQANSRIITVSDEMLQELTNLKR